ncbi:MAG: aminodeoxychorismate/anthranilate synthase component II [Candidatus Omnitrophica bacterium]|nr:aminodeoxychorismate/anthranilate synthase component II [Candidatus Omnitrophota bacterium]
MILVIDNYDSFTYNLVQYFGELKQDVKVLRNDKVSIAGIKKLRPKQIVISPGPCTPKEAGMSVEIILNFYEKIPLLGVCLGHQCLGYAFGANIISSKTLMHGKTSKIFHDRQKIFKGIPNPFKATRYHSLSIEERSMPKTFKITARSDDGEIMAIEHLHLPVFGVQFHPESILTIEGKNILQNFLKQRKKK